MIKKLVGIYSIVFFLTACPPDGFNVQIVNQSNEDIFYLCHSPQWYEIPSIHSYMGEIDKNLILKGKVYVDWVTEYALEGDGLTYTLFNYDSVKTIPWKRICDERIILKEVTFNSLEDLKRCNFEITWP